MKEIKQVVTAKQALARRNDLKSIWSFESLLTLDCLIAVLSHLENKPKRKPTAYNRFFAKKVKEGLSAQAIAKEWQEKK